MHTLSFFPSGTYYSDGSGGKHTRYPTLRRCGVGLACLSGNQFAWGAYLALPGRVQTVLRADIFAIFLLCLFAERGATLTLVTDSFTAFRVLAHPTSWPSSHLSLWLSIRSIISTKQLVLSPRWIRSHQLTLGIIAPLQHVIGNECADVMAGKGAALASVLPSEASTFFHYRDVVSRVQRRLVYVLGELISQFPRASRKVAELPKVPSVPLSYHLVRSSHRIALHTSGVSCQRCLQGRPHAPKSSVLRFIASACSEERLACLPNKYGRPLAHPRGKVVWVAGQPTHSSHCLITFRGMAVCSQCGYRASRRMVRLADPCQPRSESLHETIMTKFAKGCMLTGMFRWPDESRGPGLSLSL